MLGVYLIIWLNHNLFLSLSVLNLLNVYIVELNILSSRHWDFFVGEEE